MVTFPYHNLNRKKMVLKPKKLKDNVFITNWNLCVCMFQTHHKVRLSKLRVSSVEEKLGWDFNILHIILYSQVRKDSLWATQRQHRLTLNFLNEPYSFTLSDGFSQSKDERRTNNKKPLGLGNSGTFYIFLLCSSWSAIPVIILVCIKIHNNIVDYP